MWLKSISKLKMLMWLKSISKLKMLMEVLNLENLLLRKLRSEQLLIVGNILIGLGFMMMERRRQGVIVVTKIYY